MGDYNFKELESLLAEVRKFAVPPKEPTLFAVGGRGYYENPASDLLAFFLKPNAEHGLGDLFLSTFLKCMGADHPQLDLNHVDVQREVRTQEQKRIDLQILGTDWCLLIENKIYHWEANPFASYENHAKRLGKRTKLYSVLSPSGRIQVEGKQEDWIGVAYPGYCKALRLKLPEIDSNEPRSKWRLFARELILHLENELYIPPMTPEQVAFVEKHSSQITEVQKLASQYSEFILDELNRRLHSDAPGFRCDIREEAWRFQCTSSHWGETEIDLLKPSGREQKFSVRVYLKNLSEPQLSNAKTALGHMQPPVVEGRYLYWTSRTGFDSRQEAIDELCKLAQLATDLLKT